MATSKRFAVGLIGIRGPDRQILQRVFQISTHRSRAYSLIEEGGDVEGRADIVILNAEDNHVMQGWQARVSKASESSAQTLVLASRQKAAVNDASYGLSLPFRATHVLALLDKITVSRMNYIPELTISEEEQADGVDILADAQPAAAEAGHQYTAMVVDDSLPVRKKIAIELKMLGAQVDLAESGEQALQMIKHPKKFDIIFLDVMMPGVDGYRVCKAIKRDVRRKSTPVVMLTGKSSRFDKVKGSLAGCDTYLTKPVRHEEFQAVAKRLLAEGRAN